jgi:hypothetical protein
MLLPMEALVRLVHNSKANIPMSVTLFGIAMLVRLSQL